MIRTILVYYIYALDCLQNIYCDSFHLKFRNMILFMPHGEIETGGVDSLPVLRSASLSASVPSKISSDSSSLQLSASSKKNLGAMLSQCHESVCVRLFFTRVYNSKHV